MHLPSSIPRYGSVELLDLDEVPYEIARKPANATLRAWPKAEETERRWTMFDWATWAIPEHNRNSRLLRDFASAYLMSFEATLQVLSHELSLKSFDDWLKQQSAYDLTCRGLRTLRHLEAHIRLGHVAVNRNMAAISRFASTSLGGQVAWTWVPIALRDLRELKYPKIEESELDQWNTLCTSTLALDLMRRGIAALAAFLTAAGP